MLLNYIVVTVKSVIKIVIVVTHAFLTIALITDFFINAFLLLYYQGKIPDERKVGYGVRQPKVDSHGATSYNMPKREQPIKPVGELGEERNKVRPM